MPQHRGNRLKGTAMKYEMLMIRSLFVATLLVCGLIVGNMLVTPREVVQLAAAGSVGSSMSVATGCALPPDGLICPRVRS
jgi:hypothetical protein